MLPQATVASDIDGVAEKIIMCVHSHVKRLGIGKIVHGPLCIRVGPRF